MVGAAWGDEGKGKITDALAAGAGVVARFQGGRNAGHTIVNDLGRFALHLPSGVFRPGVTNLLGPGVAVDPAALLEELDGLTAAGVPAPDLRISDRAQLVLPSHVLADRCEEEHLGGRAFGSTRAGIAPFYADKCLKVGVQVGDLFHGTGCGSVSPVPWRRATCSSAISTAARRSPSTAWAITCLP